MCFILFLFYSKYLLISLVISPLAKWLSGTGLLCFQILGKFTILMKRKIPWWFPLLTFHLIPIYSENILCIISIILKLLRFVLWLEIWSILTNVPCSLEKYVYPTTFKWSILLIWSQVSWWHYLSHLHHSWVFFVHVLSNTREECVEVSIYKRGFVFFPF